MRIKAVTAATLGFLLAVVPCLSLEWHNTQPPPRKLATIVVDEARHRAVLFGGEGTSAWNDVWQMSLDSVTGYDGWTRVSTSGTPPAGRLGHAAIYDAGHDRMVVFGGITAGNETNDLWQLDLATGAWQELSPSGTPPGPRVFVTAVYHPDRHSMLVLDGKYGSDGIDDLWELDLDSLAWHKIQVQGTHPAGRWSYGLVLDRDSNALIVFAGQAGNSLVNELWKLDLEPGNEAWTELNPSGDVPDVRANCACCWVPEQRTFCMFAGFTYPIFTFLNDLYTLDLTSLTWTRLNPTGELPPERRCPAGTYDPYNHIFLTFGGENYGGCLGDASYISTEDMLGTREWQPVQSGRSRPLLEVLSISSRPVSVLCRIPETGQTSVRIIDASGRMVRTLLSSTSTAGARQLSWDGKDAAGQTVPAGNYFCRLETGSSRCTRRFALVE
jgi:hypothetical protein